MNRGGLAMPRKAPDALKSCNMNFRATGKLKAALQKAADGNKRTLSQEMAHRLELSFVYEQTIGDVKQYERMRKKAIDVQNDPTKSPGRFYSKEEMAEIDAKIEAKVGEEMDAFRKSIAALLTKSEAA
jgi:hypothetical protein